MKKLLVILMLGAGLNAYAGTLALDNGSQHLLAVECFPSKTVCNGISENDGKCLCAADDTYMYFGHTGMPQDETTYLIPHTTFTTTWVEDSSSGYHFIIYGDVWKVLKDTTDTTSVYQVCVVAGDPTEQVACQFSNTL